MFTACSHFFDVDLETQRILQGLGEIAVWDGGSQVQHDAAGRIPRIRSPKPGSLLCNISCLPYVYMSCSEDRFCKLYARILLHVG